MRHLLFIFVLLSIAFGSCKKTIQAPSYPSFNGQWLWIGTGGGVYLMKPSSDSLIILTLGSENNYTTTLNGQLVLQGTFTIDSGSNTLNLIFDNITHPFGNNNSGIIGGAGYVNFNYFKIGQFTLYQVNQTHTPGDTLYLLRSPITPESPVSYFKKLP
jgi:hypothetical protein